MLAASQRQGAKGFSVSPGTRSLPRTWKRFRRRLVFISGLILFLALTFGKAYLSMQVVLKGYQLEDLKREIYLIKRENEQLQKETARLKTPERIAQVATGRLGMGEPSSEQICYCPPEAREESRGSSGSASSQTRAEGNSWLVVFSRALQGWLQDEGAGI